MSSNIFYVYQYLTEDGVPYYVGKGKEKRAYAAHAHVAVPADPGLIKFVQTGLSEADALKLEMALIRTYGREVDGGLLKNTKLNQWACTSGWKHSEETKKKISESTAGIKKSETTREKMRHPKTDAHREKIRIANLGRVNDGRYDKIGKKKRLQRWYTDGVTSTMCIPGQEPEGYVAGRKIKVVL